MIYEIAQTKLYYEYFDIFENVEHVPDVPDDSVYDDDDTDGYFDIVEKVIMVPTHPPAVHPTHVPMHVPDDSDLSGDEDNGESSDSDSGSGEDSDGTDNNQQSDGTESGIDGAAAGNNQPPPDLSALKNLIIFNKFKELKHLISDNQQYIEDSSLYDKLTYQINTIINNFEIFNPDQIFLVLKDLEEILMTLNILPMNSPETTTNQNVDTGQQNIPNDTGQQNVDTGQQTIPNEQYTI